MDTESLPKTMRAWQYSNTSGGMENSIRLNTVPLPVPKADQHLVKILHVCLNPVDVKPAEVGLMSRMMIPKPATPGIDFAGRIVRPAPGSAFKPGQLVFGGAGSSPFAGGALREYATTELSTTVAAPEGAKAKDLSTIAVAGETAWQTIIPHVKPGDKIFINGGSGGVGVFGIQLAKQAGCTVTTTCSTPNVELCKSLGADQVIDYKKQNVVATLKAEGPVYNHVVDNVGGDFSLYFKAHEYTKPGAKFVLVGASLNFSFFYNSMKIAFLPGFLGGGKRKFLSFFAKPNNEELGLMGRSMAEGKLKPVIDSEFAFEDVSKALARLKTGRARGKICINVAPEA